MFDIIVNLRTIGASYETCLEKLYNLSSNDLLCHIMRPPGEWALKFLNYFCTLFEGPCWDFNYSLSFYYY